MTSSELGKPDTARAVEILKRILELELAGLVRYLHYSFMIFGHNRIPIVAWLRSQAVEAQAHAVQAAEQLLASGGQENPAADTIKKLETAFVFQIADLSRQGRLADTQTQCRFRNRAQVGYRDEGPQAFEVHPAYLQNA